MTRERSYRGVVACIVLRPMIVFRHCFEVIGGCVLVAALTLMSIPFYLHREDL